MAATAFICSIVVKYQDGYSEQIPCTASDVNAANWLGPDGLAPIRISGAHGNAIISDIILGPVATDTRTSTLEVNGRRIPEIVLHAANYGAVVGRQFQQTPLKLTQGAVLEFTQNT
jgi:hypothetical protein